MADKPIVSGRQGTMGFSSSSAIVTNFVHGFDQDEEELGSSIGATGANPSHGSMLEDDGPDNGQSVGRAHGLSCELDAAVGLNRGLSSK